MQGQQYDEAGKETGIQSKARRNGKEKKMQKREKMGSEDDTLARASVVV